MSLSNKAKWLTIFFSGTGIVVLFAACAATGPPKGDPATGVSLRYHLPSNKPLNYSLSNTVNQNLEVMGQSMDTDVNTNYEIQVNSTGFKKNRHQLRVTINDMNMGINSTQGNFSPDVSAISGKSFTMALSPFGRETALTGAESLTYNLGQAGDRSIASDFQGFFPDLSDRPVKIGDSWTTWDTLHISDSSSDIRMIMNHHHTLDGVETINGRACVRIASQVSGIMDGKGFQQGTPLEFNGKIQGADTWFFDYREGVFVKSVSESTTDANIDAGGMSIPLTLKIRAESSLVQ